MVTKVPLEAGRRYPVKITYFKKVLKVEIDHTKEGSNYMVCFEKRGVDLPLGNYMGLSTSTNQYPDTYELYMFRTSTFSMINRHGDEKEIEDKMSENEILKDEW